METHFYPNCTEDIEAVLTVLLQLRPQFSLSSLEQQITRQQRDGYQVVYLKQQHDILAVAGFRVAEKLGWGKHLYIDDLVTNEQKRSQGAGAFLIHWLQKFAQKNGCQQIHLDSGVNRFAAHKFYFRENFTISSHHFLQQL